nr:DUF4747 family protein [Alishewanella maricola]
MHPHTPESYVELLTSAGKSKYIAKLGRRQLAVITAVGKYDNTQKAKTAIIRGEIDKFTDIDTDGDWFNINDMKLAEDTDLERINLLEHLKPNTERFYFLFDPNKHLLFYEAYSKGHRLTPSIAKKTLELILNHKSLTQKFGKIEVTHLPKTDALDSALLTKTIRQMTFKISRPNADHFEDAEVAFLNKMNKRNVAQIDETLTAAKGCSIVVDEQLKTQAKIAAKNGVMKLEGRDNAQKPVHFSTLEHPRIETEYYDSKIETPLSFLYQMTLKFLGKP